MTMSALQSKRHRRPHASITGAGRIVVRRANHDDLNAILNIGLAAMPLDPQWDWRFPHRTIFPEDHRQYTCDTYREFLENSSGNWLVMVAEQAMDDAPDRCEPMAFAVWNLSKFPLQPDRRTHRLTNMNYSTSSAELKSSQLSQSFRKDAKPNRLKAWNDAMAIAKAQIFDEPFGRQYLQLQILATNPTFHRQGAATELCKWGQKLARTKGLPLAVFASPMGNLLYTHLGFKWRDNIIIRASGEEEYIKIDAMVYEPFMTKLVHRDQ